MNEIEVGEWIRTEDGQISKNNSNYNWDLKETYINDSPVVKHSKNKIDLVEVGDYVNGELVVDIDRYYNEDGKYCGCRLLTQYRIAQFTGLDRRYYLYEDDIKSILTKQSFKEREYIF